jgi:hypothetical protein
MVTHDPPGTGLPGRDGPPPAMTPAVSVPGDNLLADRSYRLTGYFEINRSDYSLRERVMLIQSKPSNKLRVLCTELLRKKPEIGWLRISSRMSNSL